MFEPTEEMKAAYKRARLPPEISLATDLADLAQHATAVALKEHFWANHSMWKPACGKNKKTEFGIIMQPCTRLEHDYDDADWLRLADEKLREVKR